MADFWNILIFLLWWEKWTWFSGGGLGGVNRGKRGYSLLFTMYNLLPEKKLFLLRFTSAIGKPQLLIVKFDGRFLECINFSATMETL